MTAAPKYVERIARLPRVLETLASHPNGLAIATLAGEVGVPADELREDLLAFFSADIGPDLLMGLSRPPVIEFLGPEGDDDVDPNEAEVVRINDPRPSHELGVEYVDAAELGLIYTAAQALLELDPHDEDLAGAIDVLAETMYGDHAASPEVVDNAMLQPLHEARAERRQVRITYSRSWHAGVSERVIEPYHLVQTRRGWEVDAGPGELRTFLVSNIRAVEKLDLPFDLPDRLDDLLREHRAAATVRVLLPQSARWAADMYAERVSVVDEDEYDVTLDLALLPPLEHRVGLLILASGSTAMVISPAELVDADAKLAAELLEHHGG